MKTAMLTLAFMLPSCAVTLQKTADGSMNYSGSLFSKNAVTGMSGPAGNVEGIVSDSEAAATALATAYGVGVTVKGATKTAIANTNAEKAKVISSNKTNARIKGIEASAATKQAAINAGTP